MNKLGIDYGTSTTLISSTKGPGTSRGTTRLIDIGIGGDRTGYLRSSVPSLVAIDKTGVVKFGYDAEELLKRQSLDGFVVLKSLKRCLNCNEKAKPRNGKCQNLMVAKYCLGGQNFKIHDSDYSAKYLIRKFIENVMDAEDVGGEIKKKSFSGIGMTVPALFNRDPRKTVYDILLPYLQSQSVNSVEVINEPTAALIAGQEDLFEQKDGIIAVCDIGGGTTDIVLLEKHDQNLFLFSPVGISVAGDDVDKAIYDYLDLNGHIDPMMDQASVSYEIKRAKELLTNLGRATVFGHALTKSEFERAVTPVIEKIVDALKHGIMKVHEHYKNTKKEFKLIKIYLSGGGSKVPLVKKMMTEDRLLTSFNPAIDFISNKVALQLYEDDAPIVMVAMGASMPRSGIRDSIQHMLPYDIEVRTDGRVNKKIISYEKLPIDFIVVAEKAGTLQLFARDPGTNKVVYDLGGEMVSDTVSLSEFMGQARTIGVLITENNFMTITLRTLRGAPTRRFKLPWQGGIEPEIFEKYRKEWRKKRGLA